MGRKIAAGVLGGLIGGLVFDVVMRALPLATAQGSMITFAADAVHAPTPLAGWFVYPVYGVVIGAVFGWLLYGRPLAELPAALAGGLYGVSWWIVAELLLVPALFGAWPLSESAVELLRNTAFPLLVGHVVYGVFLGVSWAVITRASTGHGAGGVGYAARRAA